MSFEDVFRLLVGSESILTTSSALLVQIWHASCTYACPEWSASQTLSGL